MAGQALNATFFAFKKRERGALLPTAIAFGLLMLVLYAVFAAAVWAIIGQDFFTLSQQMTEMGAKDGSASGALPPGFGRYFLIVPIELVWMFFLFVGLASFESACLRWMIRGERSGALNLHFGADMWRVYGTYWMWFLYFLGTYILFIIVIIATAAVAAIAGGRDNPLMTGTVVILVGAAWVLGWIYVAVRLAPASATSIGVRHFAPLKAWAVSRGRFWALFGSYFLLFVIYMIGLIVAWAVLFGPMYAHAFGQIDWTSASGDPQGFSQRYNEANVGLLRDMFGSPLAIALYIAGQVLIYTIATLFSMLFYGVNARALLAAAQDGKVEAPGIDVAETFS